MINKHDPEIMWKITVHCNVVHELEKSTTFKICVEQTLCCLWPIVHPKISAKSMAVLQPLGLVNGIEEQESLSRIAWWSWNGNNHLEGEKDERSKGCLILNIWPLGIVLLVAHVVNNSLTHVDKVIVYLRKETVDCFIVATVLISIVDKWWNKSNHFNAKVAVRCECLSKRYCCKHENISDKSCYCHIYEAFSSMYCQSLYAYPEAHGHEET